MPSFDPSSPVNVLADRFWESILELNPTLATVYGDERYADRLEDPSAQGRARLRALMDATLADATAIDPGPLSVEDRITRDMLAVIAGIGIEEDDQQIHQLRVVDQIGGPQTLLAQIVQFQPADTAGRLEQLVARIRAYGPFMAANTQILRDGIRSGLTAPRIATERTVDQLDRLLAVPPEQSPIVTMAKVAAERDREPLLDAVREVVYPADAEFLRVLRDEYLPVSRVDPGIWSAPNGEAIYRTQIRYWTTLEIEPQEVHRIGLEDLDGIEAERRAIARAAGFGDDTAAYRAALAADSSNVPASPEQMLERARDDIARAMAVAPRYFGRLPQASVDVRAVESFKEKDSPFAYYFPPATDGSRGGIYYANTYDLPSRTFTTLASTTYHEAVPGHHFQIALEQENPDLNTFRRLGARMAGGAYVEGWGLYSERLADEMGLYRSEGERFGMLDGQAWRAARLVVDSGMHGLRWTRQQSIDFLLRTGLTNTNAVIETDRYIVWPGQALTYKLGHLQIAKLRAELSARDGDRFDLREFHDQVLGHGSLPLATLARELPGWLREPA
ncbi:MAG TPA: DUF885 domain-containing protein [Candidatus Limnocylindrales bacterium]|nr:DUF885 domain-containing protein [Candidatus Limnocylindrales bacterium]